MIGTELGADRIEAGLGKRVCHENVVRTFDVDALLIAGQPCHFT